MSEYIYYCKFSAGMLVLCSLIFCYISEWSERNIRSYFFLIFAHFAGGGGEGSSKFQNQRIWQIKHKDLVLFLY